MATIGSIHLPLPFVVPFQSVWKNFQSPSQLQVSAIFHPILKEKDIWIDSSAIIAIARCTHVFWSYCSTIWMSFSHKIVLTWQATGDIVFYARNSDECSFIEAQECQYKTTEMFVLAMANGSVANSQGIRNAFETHINMCAPYNIPITCG